MIVARVDKRAVGFALCDYFENETGVYLEEVGVVTKHQGKNIGTNLIHECVRHARSQGFLTMWASPLSGEEHRGLWLQRLGLLPNTEGVQSSLDEIICLIEDYQTERPRSAP